MNAARKLVISLVGLVAIVLMLSVTAGASLPRNTAVGSELSDGQAVVVKFAEGSGVSLDAEGQIVSDGQLVADVAEVLSQSPVIGVSRLFSRPADALAADQDQAEVQSGEPLPDLNLFYSVDVLVSEDAILLVDELDALTIVETAYLAPLPGPIPVTADFEPLQGYLNAAPGGIDANIAWTRPGGRGDGITIADVEYSWNTSHEDLSTATDAKILISGGESVTDPFSDNNHGTAVLGEIIADNNGLGVTGIVSDADIRLAPTSIDGSFSVAVAINRASAALSAGDVILIEQQTQGAHGGCNASGQTGCVPVEFNDAEFAAIQIATALGITVVEAAGNGSEDLDHTDYGGKFDRSVRDSGAIIVGAGVPPGFSSPARSKLGFSTYGSRVDVQAWGTAIVTTGYGTQFDGGADRLYASSFGGTSGASPIVTGAVAAIQGILDAAGDPFLTPAQMRALLVSTGTAQTDSTAFPAASFHIGPLPDLAVAVPNDPPVSDANGPYFTDEGTDVSLDGTGSSDPDDDALTYDWDLDDDGSFDDATGTSPTFTMVGQDGVFTVCLRVTDLFGLTDEDCTTVTVANVAPSVSLGSDAPVDENSTVTVTGTVTDPGWLDPLSATIDWDDGSPLEPTGGVLENVRPNATLTFSVSHIYGDNGTFTAEVCASDDDTTTCESIDLQIDNVDPTADIDLSGTILINGVPTILAHAGDPVDFSGRSTDPGSDDLTIRWDWDDGSPVESTTYLVNPPNPDPFPSPSIQPRDVTDLKTHSFADACLYEVSFWAEDDDGGTSPVDTVNVIIVGNADEVRSAGYWQNQFRSHITGRGHSDFDQPELECYLEIVGYMSQVFDEVRDASTFDSAYDVLFVNRTAEMIELLDRQLLGAWLNFANGSIEYDELVDTDGDTVPDTTLADALAAAEAVRLNLTATHAELEEQKDILERINLIDS